MIGTIINGALRLVAIVAIALMALDVLGPWMARHEVSVLVRPVPHPIVRGPVEWRT
jgi:hypothetical protein